MSSTVTSIYRRPFRRQAAIGSQALLQDPPLGMLVVCFGVAALILATGPAAVLSIAPNVVVWLTAGILSAFLIATWQVAKVKGDNPWIAASCLVMAQYFLRYGIGAVAAYYWRVLPWQVPSMRQAFSLQGVWENLPLACRLAILSAFGFYVGLQCRGKVLISILPRVNWPVDERKLKSNLFICVPLFALAYAWLGPYISKNFQFMAEAMADAVNGMLLMGSYYLFNRRPESRIKWTAFIVLVYLCELPSAARSGQMEPLLMPGFLMVCGYVVARRSLPWVALVVGIPLIIYVVVPLAAFYKLSKTEDGSIESRAESAREAFSKASYDTRLELALERTVVRFAGITMPATFVQYYPARYPFALGRTFLIEAAGLIPRVIWEHKPEQTELNLYSEAVGLFPRGSPTSMIFDGVSEYYVNFGDVGVFFISIVNGWYLALLYNWLVRHGHYTIGPAIYLSLMAGNWDCFGVGLIASAHIRFLPFWIIAFYLMSHHRHE